MGKKDFYGQSLLDRKIVNPNTYKGRGRPRATDYITILKAQMLWNRDYNKFLDSRILK